MTRIRQPISIFLLLMMASTVAVWAVAIANAETEHGSPVSESIALNNPACEAIVLIKPFVRLISFRLAGGRNHLVDFNSPNPKRNDGQVLRPLFVTGAKLWPSSETRDFYKFGLLEGRATQNGLEVEVRMGPDPVTGFEGTILFKLDPKEARVTITSTLRNTEKTERDTGCWWPVTFDPGGRMEAQAIPLPKEPAYAFHFWSGNASTESACVIDDGHVTLDLDQPLRRPIFKIGFLGREITVSKPDCVYRLTAIDPAPSAKQVYPDGGSAVIFYSDQRTLFCEAELTSPLAHLRPNDSTSFTFALSVEPPSRKDPPKKE